MTVAVPPSDSLASTSSVCAWYLSDDWRLRWAFVCATRYTESPQWHARCNMLAHSDVSSLVRTAAKAVTARKTAIPLTRKRKRHHPLPFRCTRVAAPMVGASDPAFRLLVRRHGSDCAYTEMADAERFVADSEYRKVMLTSCAQDRPLVLQLAGNDAELLGKATALAAASAAVDAVDLNLGCPQTKAKEKIFGAYLLDNTHRTRVLAIARSMVESSLGLPVFCKIRISPDLQDCIALCQGLEEAGVALIAVHGRERGTPKRRRSGPADLNAIRCIVEAVSIPVLTNGNVRVPSDVVTNLQSTQAHGAMCAEPLLENPGLFDHSVLWPSRAKLGALAMEYLGLAREWPPHEEFGGIQCVRGHVTWMLGRQGRGFSTNFKHAGMYRHNIPALRQALLDAQTMDDFEQIVQDTLLWSCD